MIIRQLDNGIRVAVGYLHKETYAANPVINDKYLALDSKVRVNSANTVIASFGHSVALVGYYLTPDLTGGGYFVFRNSGGADWGDHGYGYMTFDFVKKAVFDILVFSKSTSNIYDFTKLRKDILLNNSSDCKMPYPFLDTQGLKTQDSLMRRKP